MGFEAWDNFKASRSNEYITISSFSLKYGIDLLPAGLFLKSLPDQIKTMRLATLSGKLL